MSLKIQDKAGETLFVLEDQDNSPVKTEEVKPEVKKEEGEDND